MNLFVNDIPIRLYGPKKILQAKQYDLIINTKNQLFTKYKLEHRIWLKNATITSITQLLDSLDKKKTYDGVSIDISAQNYKDAKKYIKNQFKIIDAAGGIVFKQSNEILLIYRLKKWDLPKGKKEGRETYAQVAKREIEEECNITVEALKKICVTWHTYNIGKEKILKQTHWYIMDLIDDTNMKPCLEEGIKTVQWMNQEEAHLALKNSYESIRFVFKKYSDLTKKRILYPNP